MCKHGENMPTPHRKALEIAHLNTANLGENMPPQCQQRPMQESNPRPSDCEAVVQAPGHMVFGWAH